MTSRLWILGTVLVVLGVIALGWFLGVAPKLVEASAARSQLSVVEAQNASHRAVIAELEEKFERIDELRTELGDLQTQIPDHQNFDEFADAIQAAQTGTGVVVTRFAAEEVAIFGLSPEGETTTEDIPAIEVPPGLYVVPVTVETTSDAASFVRFTRALQSNERIFFADTIAWLEDEAKGTISGYLYVVHVPGSEPPIEPTPTETPAP